LNGAVAALTRARQISPTSGFIRNDLAAALKDQGDLAGAIAEYKEAVRLDPNNGHIHDQLARLLATGPDGLRDGKRAVALATRSCELSQWKFAGYIDTLAAAYAENGDFNKAVEYQKKALAFPSRAKGESKQAEQRLELYTRKQPYRDPKLVLQP
jgi:tetratricopeptide (TPR) repeat protein